jgi:hypothetical protein
MKVFVLDGRLLDSEIIDRPLDASVTRRRDSNDY